MICVPCGYDALWGYRSRFGCGRWVGYQDRFRTTVKPYFFNGRAWCLRDACGLFMRHTGAGMFVWKGPDDLLEEALAEGVMERKPDGRLALK